jgi:hypothetical protein
VVTRTPNLIRTLATIRDNVDTNATRVRREDITFAPADWTRGEPAVAATMTNVLVTSVHRSGHILYADIAAGLGDASSLSAQLTVPNLGLTGPAVTSGEGGIEQDLRLKLAISDIWEMGAAQRVYVQAMRVSGADATTLRLLRAWQR